MLAVLGDGFFLNPMVYWSVGLKWVKGVRRTAMEPKIYCTYTGFVLRINLQHGEVFKATSFPRTRTTLMSFQRYVKGGFLLTGLLK
jgi:hypothetical protein